MKKTIFSLIILILFLISGCAEQVMVCNKPYILVGNSCCLDKNDNNICDSDEKIEEKEIEEEKTVEQKTEEVVEEIEEKPKQESIKPAEEEPQKEINIDDLKNGIINIYGEKREWNKESDKIDPSITYYSYYPFVSTYKEFVVIVDIDKELNTYDEFLNFQKSEFNYGYEESETKNFENESLWKKQWGITREWNTSSGKIIEFGSYNKRIDDYTFVHNSFNIHCSPTKLIRIYPNWIEGFGSNFLGLNYDVELNVLNQFNTNVETILPKITKIIELCPLITNKVRDKRIPAVEKFINEELGTDYVFLVEDNPTIESHRTMNTNRVIIERLGYEINDFESFIKTRLNDSIELVDKKSRESAESSELKDYRDSGTFYNILDNYTVTRTINKEEIKRLVNGENIIETVYGAWDKYDNILSKPSYSGTYLRKEDLWERYILMHKISILCKPDLVINFYGEFEYPFKEYGKFTIDLKNQINSNFDNQLNENRESLLVQTKEILGYCNTLP